VVLTIFDGAGALDLEGQLRCVDFMIDAGSKGLCILANFPEQFVLTDAERDQVMQAVLRHVGERVLLQLCALRWRAPSCGMARRQRGSSRRPDRIFKGRQFTAEVILWAVRWYLIFPISYRDLELMLQDRGVEIAHTTIFRWIQAYAPKLEKRIRPYLRPSNGS
jgi:hypothetical protein